MILRGKIEGGKIVLDEAKELPEGAAVEVYVMAPKDPNLMRMNPNLAKYFGIADDLPPNASQTIDQVLYGTPDE